MAESPSRLLLLDTHVWVWLLGGNEPLRTSPARAAIEAAAEPGALRVSIISVWEVGMLESRGRLGFPGGAEAWVRRALAAPGISLAAMTPQVALASTRLPGLLHGDPADRILVATARELGATLVTRDRRIIEYAATGHLETIPV